MSWIKNVLIETGREEVTPNNIVTKTKLVSMYIENGLIKQITDTVPSDADGVVDAKGYLAVPSLGDRHIHLDKGHFGGNWQAVVPMRSVADRIVEEQGFLRDFLADTPKKAQALIDLLTSNGATFLRVQVNVDPTIGLDNLIVIREVLKKNKDKLDYEIVAFPQHGTLITEEQGLLSKALEEEGVSILGGVDPATIDTDIEKSLKTTFELASKYNKEVDIHLHDHGSLGIFEINRIIEYTHSYQLQGKVRISHALALGHISGNALDDVARRLKQADIEIHTTVPVGSQALSIPVLRSHGVKVHAISDCINDHWSPFGSGDLIQRASRAAEVFGMSSEVALSRALGLVTDGVTPLDDEGKQVWPMVGHKANILFAKAESSAHLVARICPERVVLFNGEFVSGEFK